MARLGSSQPFCLLLGLLLFTAPLAWPEARSRHQRFDDVLRRHVVDGQVDYPSIANDPEFGQYIEQLKDKPAFTSQQEGLAYWINAYNALAIQGILDGRSPRTLFGRFGFFKRAKYHLGGNEVNLYDLEKKVLVPLHEPRIHFAINCASASCPKLASSVYTAAELEGQLEASTRAFINDPTRNQFDRDNKVAYVSKIFHWSEDEFRQQSGSVQKYIARYVNDPVLAQSLANDGYTLKYLPYDWRLNGTSPGE